MGTMLQAAGLEPGDAPERLNTASPKVVRSIHEAYIAAGADVVTTNTFGGNRFRLSLHGLNGCTRELNQAGAGIAREAADGSGRRVLVAGSAGPTGALLQPVGELSFEDARDIFAEQCRGLAEGGADFILLETMSDLEEVRAGAEGARVACGLPVFCTMTFDTHGRTMMGVSPRRAALEMAGAGIRAIGSNCGNGPSEMEKILNEMSLANPGLPLIVQSNAGIPRAREGEVRYEAGAREMAAHAVRCREGGARYIGGCCGTTPAHIRAMSEALRRGN